MLLEMLNHASFGVTKFFMWNFSEFIFFFVSLPVRFKYSCHIAWVWKLNHNKDNRHVSPIIDSQTVQVQTCTDTLGYDINSKLCLRNSALIVVCRTALWKVESVVFSFCEVFCVKGFCLLYFHHAKAVLKSSWRLPLHVW